MNRIYIGLVGCIFLFGIATIFGGFQFLSVSLLVIVIFILLDWRQYLLMKRVGLFLTVLGVGVWYSVPAVVLSLDFENGMSFNTLVDVYVSEPEMIYVIQLLLLFFASYLCLYALCINIWSRLKFKFSHEYSLLRMIRLSIFMSIVGVIPYLLNIVKNPSGFLFSIISSRSSDAAKQWAITGNVGNEETAYLVLVKYLLVGGSIFLFHALLNETVRNKKLYAFFIISIFILVVLDTGTRTLTGLIMLPSVVIYLLNNSKKVGIAKIAVVMFAFVLLLQVQLFTRTGDYDYKKFLTASFWGNIVTLGGTTDFISETSYAINLVPNQHEFFHESNIALFATHLIPRFIWPDKPISEISRFYNLKRWGLDIMTDGGNVLPGIIGQYYMSDGVIGIVIISFVFAVVTSLSDRILLETFDQPGKRYWSVLAVSTSVLMLLSFRVFSPGYFVPLFFFAVLARIFATNVTNARRQ